MAETLPKDIKNIQITDLQIPPEFIDEYGHLNYKASPALLEPAQDLYMDSRGIGFARLQKEFGIRSMVKTYTVTINQQIFPQDVLQVQTQISEVGERKFIFSQQILKNGESAIDYELTVVCVGEDNKSTLIPDPVREVLTSELPQTEL